MVVTCRIRDANRHLDLPLPLARGWRLCPQRPLRWAQEPSPQLWWPLADLPRVSPQPQRAQGGPQGAGVARRWCSPGAVPGAGPAGRRKVLARTGGGRPAGLFAK